MAPGRTAPELSETMPVMVPASTCALRGWEQAISIASAAEKLAISLVIYVPSFPEQVMFRN